MSASLQEPPFASGEKSANREAKRKAEDQTAIAGLWFWFGGFGLFVVGLSIGLYLTPLAGPLEKHEKALTAILGILTLWVISRQVYWMRQADSRTRRQIRIADRSLRVAQSAHIHVASWTLTVPEGADVVPIARIEWMNTGASEGADLTFAAAFSIGHPWQAVPTYIDEPSPGTRIPPGQHGIGRDLPLNAVKIPSELVDKVRTGTESVRLWGRLQYGDIFDDTHWLPFAVELRIDKDGRTVTSFTSPRAYYLPEND